MYNPVYTIIMSKHASLPALFAIYRTDLEQFQLIQPEFNEKGSIQRLKNWARPDKASWRQSSEEEREAMLPWFHGQEWYVVPTSTAGSNEPPHIYSVKIHDDTYYWWFLRHKLVWSDYLTHHHRAGKMVNDWKASPSIPIIECNTKLIYPRTNTGFYARWSDCVPMALTIESTRAWNEIKKPDVEAQEPPFDPRDLRIKTPPPRNDDSETDTEELVQRAPRWGIDVERPTPPPINWNRVCGLIVTASILTLLVGIYTFIIAQALGA